MRVAPADFADHEHIRVVPSTRFRKWRGGVLFKADAAHAFPGVDDVASGAPATAVDRAAPFPHFSHAILAEAENDVAVLLAQQIAHDRIGINRASVIRGSFAPERNVRQVRNISRCHAAVTAPVVFQIIKAPLRIRLRILPLVLPARRATAAGPRAG